MCLQLEARWRNRHGGDLVVDVEGKNRSWSTRGRVMALRAGNWTQPWSRITAIIRKTRRWQELKSTFSMFFFVDLSLGDVRSFFDGSRKIMFSTSFASICRRTIGSSKVNFPRNSSRDRQLRLTKLSNVFFRSICWLSEERYAEEDETCDSHTIDGDLHVS